MRLTDWRQRLMGREGPVECARTRPFSWKSHNCAAFGGRCVAAVTGENPYATYDEACASEDDANAILTKMGCTDIEDATAKHFPQISPGEVQAGDLGIIERRGKKILVVCLGALCAAPGARGLMFHLRSELTAAFRVS